MLPAIIKLKNNKNDPFKWTDKIYTFDNLMFNKDVLKKYINKFWKENIDSLDKDKDSHILLLTRIRRDNGQVATIGNLQRLNLDEKDYLLDHLLYIIDLKTGGYNEVPINALIFSFGIRSGLAPLKGIQTDVKYQYYHQYKLPITMDPLKYGKVIEQLNNIYFIQIINNNAISLKVEDKINYIKLFKSGDLKHQWTDTYIDDSTFIRDIDNRKYTFVNDELKLLTIEKPNKFIKPIKKKKYSNDKILTMDLETRLIDNNHNPYCLSIYDGNIAKSFFITDYLDVKDMVLSAIKYLAKRKYDNYNIYLHNFSKFDVIFLFKILVNIGIVTPIINKGRFISMQFNYNDYVLHFKDSYLLLPASLKKLGLSFKIKQQKGFFPHLFVNKNDISLDYIGNIPNRDYFINLSENDYNDYCLNYNNWNLKSEAIKYCELDCISLYQILIKFNNIIFEKYNLNINNYPTLPSLAFAIFRAHYLLENTIIEISGKIYNDIKKSYTGGAVDMYIPQNDINEKVYGYDVNSLYPSEMMKSLMPVSDITYFEGDIRKFDSNAFGFFHCKIITPTNLEHPILQTHIKTKEGIRTMAALGRYEDMIFSGEMDNAIKLGYKFEILWGYTFKSMNVFEEIISDLYSLRLKYHKSDPMNYIAKILMNSLYGRFGMDDSFNEIMIIDKDLYDNFLNKFPNIEIVELIDLDNKLLIQYKSKDNIDLEYNDDTHNINIAIASSITAYSRIYMTQFKNNRNYKLFYCDTDSIYINKKLDDSFVNSNKLGKLKLEITADKAIFLASKVYSLLSNNKIITKVKGLNKDVVSQIKFSDLESLLYKNSKLELSHEKWYKSLEKSTINIIDQIYTLKVTGNKRKLIYDKNSKLINTKPFKINNNEIVI